MNISTLNPFRRRSATELAAEEFERAKRELLEAQSNCDYWDAIASFNIGRIERLQRHLRAAE